MQVVREIVFFLLTFSFIEISFQCTNYGYFFENFLGTFTPYRTVSNKSFERIEFEGCTPRKIWMLIRHGTRNPKFKIIDQMNIRLPEIKNLLINEKGLPNEFFKHRDLDLLSKWKPRLKADDKSKLTHEGEEEMLILAERMQSRFPELFDEIYSNTSYKFKYTHSERTQKSAFYFASGLFGRATAKDVWFPEPIKKDPILRFYKLCDRWHLDIKSNPKALQEYIIFLDGPEMDATIKDVNIRLNMSPDTLTKEDILLMYDTCAFETAWNKNSKSPWCAVFSLENLKILEYAKELKFYWKDGYGYELSYKQACPIFKDMFNFIQSKNRFPRVNVYFSHSGTMLKTIAHLGLYQDPEPLTAKNYDLMGERLWRAGKLDAFGSNLAFVSYQCDDQNKILVLHQENIIRLPACPDTDLCDVNTIRDYYFQSWNDCDFKSMCSIQ